MDATVAIRDRRPRPLTAFTHIAAGPARPGELFEPGTASRAVRVPANPHVDEGLATDKNSPLRPRAKIGSSDQTTHRVRWDVTECQAAVTDLGNFKLSHGRVAADGEHDERGTINVAGNGGCEWLQRHVVEIPGNNLMLQQRERRCGASPVFGDEMIS
jgi:hypothetical protein